MVISDQGWAAIIAGEQSNAAYHGAKQDAECYAMKPMVEHLNTVHGFGPRKIGKLMGLKYPLVQKMLQPNVQR